MLVDSDKRILAFALDGRLQGACPVPGARPLYVLTHVDTPADHVELRKPMLEAPRPKGHREGADEEPEISPVMEFHYGMNNWT